MATRAAATTMAMRTRSTATAAATMTMTSTTTSTAGTCGCGHHHHHDHDADEIFTSWGRETARRFTREELEQALTALDGGEYGQILRAKGIVDGGDTWYEFDMVPRRARDPRLHPRRHRQAVRDRGPS